MNEGNGGGGGGGGRGGSNDKIADIYSFKVRKKRNQDAEHVKKF